MSGPIDVVESQVVFRGRLLEVVVDRVRFPDGRETTWESVHHPGAAAVVPVGSRLLEVPAGKLDRDGEEPADCARRELVEETGYRCRSLVRLGTMLASPGFSDERIHLFLATDLTFVGRPDGTDEGDDIEIEWMPLADAERAVRDGRIEDGKTALCILLAAGHEAVAAGLNGRPH